MRETKSRKSVNGNDDYDSVTWQTTNSTAKNEHCRKIGEHFGFQ